MTLKVQALDHLVVQVSDHEVSASWYERVLGMARENVPPAPGKPARTAMLPFSGSNSTTRTFSIMAIWCALAHSRSSRVTATASLRLNW